GAGRFLWTWLAPSRMLRGGVGKGGATGTCPRGACRCPDPRGEFLHRFLSAEGTEFRTGHTSRMTATGLERRAPVPAELQTNRGNSLRLEGELCPPHLAFSTSERSIFATLTLHIK